MASTHLRLSNVLESSYDKMMFTCICFRRSIEEAGGGGPGGPPAAKRRAVGGAFSRYVSTSYFHV